MAIRYATVCSGGEAPSQAWHGLGWEPVWFSEIEPFPCEVLAHRYPHVPNLGDMTRIIPNKLHEPYGAIDLFCGGTPCQSFSVAGLREGLRDPRGNLMLVFLGMVDALQPTWVVWENVPGVLSSGGGRDFGSFLWGLEELGYGWAYRTLDARYFGVPQRRRRVFVVAHIGAGWQRAAEVLFEQSGVPGDIAAGQGKVKKNARNAGGRVAGGGGRRVETFKYEGDVKFSDTGESFTLDTGCGIKRPQGIAEQVVSPLNIKGETTPKFSEDGVSFTLDTSHSNRPHGFVTPVEPSAFNAEGSTGVTALTRSNLSKTVNNQTPLLVEPVAFRGKAGAKSGSMGEGIVSPTVIAGQDVHVFYPQGRKYTVRRFTPRECERLQGFEDDWTLVPFNGKPASDGPRYRLIGNSMAVPVMKWIGERIHKIHTQQ